MVQDVHMVLVECDKCHSQFIMVHEYPSRKVYPFGNWCGCTDSYFDIQGNGLSHKQWFDMMDEKQRQKQEEVKNNGENSKDNVCNNDVGKKNIRRFLSKIGLAT